MVKIKIALGVLFIYFFWSSMGTFHFATSNRLDHAVQISHKEDQRGEGAEGDFRSLQQAEGVFQAYEPIVITSMIILFLWCANFYYNFKKNRDKNKFRNNRLKEFVTIINESPISIIITDKEGIIEYVNPKFTRITKYTLEDVSGKTPRILKSDRKKPEEYKELWETIKTGKTWKGEFLNKDKNGNVIFCILEQFEFMPMSTKKIENGLIVMHENDPLAAHTACHCKTCHYVVDGNMYKCVLTGCASMWLEQLPIDERARSLLEAATKTGLDPFVDGYKKSINDPIKQCSLCPVEGMDKLIPIWPVPSKKPLFPNE
jgi:PAS domain S-box-containing protein